MLVVGLTGGIGSGKTTAARLFAELGVPVIDTDQIARELVEPGQPALEEVVASFGPEVLTREGDLDRARMRQLVFQDPDQRRRLEAILHPRVRETVQQRVRDLDAPYCVVAIPLLIETGQRDLVDRILVVDAPPTAQLARATKRDGTSVAEVQAIMASQATREERLAAADEVLLNDGDRARLTAQVMELHARYSELARNAGG